MEFNEHQILHEKPGSPEKKGERVCAYCEKVLGEAESEGDTHTICPECRVKYERKDPDFIEAIRKKSEAGAEQVENLKQDLAKERICIIENPDFSHQDIIQKLKDDGFIKGQLLIRITEATTPEELEKIRQKLRRVFNIEE